jgi:DNA-binding NarL/FixJ family response regulator
VSLCARDSGPTSSRQATKETRTSDLAATTTHAVFARLIARGETNSTIARRLALSQKNVRNHVSNIFTKLRVVDRGQAIVKARQAGIGVDQARTEQTQSL